MPYPSHPQPTLLGNILCALGLHRWEFKTLSTDTAVRDYARCARLCPKYERWLCVNEEPRDLRLPWSRELDEEEGR